MRQRVLAERERQVLDGEHARLAFAGGRLRGEERLAARVTALEQQLRHVESNERRPCLVVEGIARGGGDAGQLPRECLLERLDALVGVAAGEAREHVGLLAGARLAALEVHAQHAGLAAGAVPQQDGLAGLFIHPPAAVPPDRRNGALEGRYVELREKVLERLHVAALALAVAHVEHVAEAHGAVVLEEHEALAVVQAAHLHGHRAGTLGHEAVAGLRIGRAHGAAGVGQRRARRLALRAGHQAEAGAVVALDRLDDDVPATVLAAGDHRPGRKPRVGLGRGGQGQEHESGQQAGERAHGGPPVRPSIRHARGRGVPRGTDQRSLGFLRSGAAERRAETILRSCSVLASSTFLGLPSLSSTTTAG